MSAVLAVCFDQTGLLDVLSNLDESGVDALEFGVIGFDHESVITVYNEFESKWAGLAKARTLGKPLFTNVAPCMNNYLVAQRFEDALDAGESLDCTIDYVLTLKMRPVKVRLRLLASSNSSTAYVLIDRRS